ncbi:MAG: n-acetylglutamate synthase [Chloroflexota bacterium]
MHINYNGKKFTSVSNSGSGEVDNNTVFNYQQNGNVLWATYSGGAIKFGTLTGLIAEDGSLDFRYSHVNTDDIIMTGRCLSTPEILPDGRIRLHENWQWTSGDLSAGESIVEEMSA